MYLENKKDMVNDLRTNIFLSNSVFCQAANDLSIGLQHATIELFQQKLN